MENHNEGFELHEIGLKARTHDGRTVDNTYRTLRSLVEPCVRIIVKTFDLQNAELVITVYSILWELAFDGYNDGKWGWWSISQVPSLPDHVDGAFRLSDIMIPDDWYDTFVDPNKGLVDFYIVAPDNDVAWELHTAASWAVKNLKQEGVPVPFDLLNGIAHRAWLIGILVRDPEQRQISASYEI